MTEPLTPPDCDLQDFTFMPLHVARLRDSDLASEEHPEACWYAVLLWAASWHQIPAASLPDNDTVLTKLIGLGRDVRTFKKHRDGALRGFVQCSDGRLYHPVVAEQAVISWRRKLEQRWKTECARIKKANQRNDTHLPLPTFEAFHATLPVSSRLPDVPSEINERPQGQGGVSPGTEGSCPRGNGIQGTGIGTETGTIGSVSDETDADASLDGPDWLDELRALPIATGSWRLGLRVLMDQGGLTETKARNFLGKVKAGGIEPAEMWTIAEAALENGTPDPIPYLSKAAEQVIQRRAAATAPWQSGEMNPSPDKQRFWMREWTANADWRRGDRGPTPGEPGCRVAPAIQREFGVEPIEERVA